MADKNKKTKNNNFKKTLFKYALFVILCVTVGGVLGYYYAFLNFKNKILTIHPVRDSDKKYDFVNPLLFYRFSEAREFFENKELSNKLESYISNVYKNKEAENVSVFFRQLLNGVWAGVNKDEQYHPGSILKVLIMMAYFKDAESNPAALDRQLTYTSITEQEVKSIPFYLPTVMRIGDRLSIRKLIELMIVDSDNGAEQLLIDNVDMQILDHAYIALGIPVPGEGDYTISAVEYSDFLRMLYNSTYLSEKYSEEALSLMSQASFKEGIAAGVPADVLVAQKYGERVQNEGNQITKVELHNCGIVYAKSGVYTLCVMTRGWDESKLKNILKNVSSIVYKFSSEQDLN